MLRGRTFIIGMNPSAQEKVFKNSALDRLGTWCKELGLKQYYFLNCSSVPGVFNKKTVDTDMLREEIEKMTVSSPWVRYHTKSSTDWGLRTSRCHTRPHETGSSTIRSMRGTR